MPKSLAEPPTILSSFSFMKILVPTLCTIALLTGSVSAQHSGDVPPALVWNKLKGNCPASLDWAALRGKVVVVSFTDEIFPEDIGEWNEVAENFQSDQVFFFRVVAGSEFLLDQALKQTAFQGCILFDSDAANRQNFKVPHFERTVVVDQLGVIAGYSRGGPDEHDIRSLLNHQSAADLLEVPPQPRPFDYAAGVDPVPSYEVHISSAPRGELRALDPQVRPDLFIIKNQPLKLIIMDLWDTPMARIAFPENLDEGNYDVTAHIPAEDHQLLLQMAREAVQKRFGLVVEREKRAQRIYVLRHLANPSPRLQLAISSEEFMSGAGQLSIIGTAQTMQDIAHTFEGLLDVPVVDETGLKRKYDYSVSSKLSEPDAAFDLAHQLGLELTQAEGQIEMLVVQKLD